MASLVFGTRTADTKNDSVINVSAISEAGKPTPRLLDLRAGLLERIQPPRAEESPASVALHRERFPASRFFRGEASRDPEGRHASRAAPTDGFELSTTYYSSCSA